MTIVQFITHLRSQGIKLWITGSQLHYSAPAGVPLTPDFLATLKERKTEILNFLLEANQKVRLASSLIKPVTRDGSGRMPLSYAQERLWFLDQLQPGSTSYNIPGEFRITGALNLSALERAINEIIRRHETLRTIFKPGEGELVQVVNEYQWQALVRMDLGGLPEGKREQTTRELIRQESKQAFDLSCGPLARFQLLQLSPTDQVLLFTLHHIISDGWSLGVLAREFGQLYDAFSSGLNSPLPALSIQYADYAVWQRDRYQGETWKKQLAYWREQLKALPEELELPTEQPRPALPSGRGSAMALVLSNELSQGLKQFSQRHGVTLFMTLLTGWTVLLYRHTGQEDVVVGTPIANRNRKEIEGLIGFFVNTLVMRADLSGNPTFLDLLHRERKMALDAYEHQDIPFEQLVQELQPERDLGRNPLFQVFFNLVNLGEETLQLRGVQLSIQRRETVSAKFDLTLYAQDAGKRVSLEMVYNPDLYAEPRIGELLNQLRHLFEQIIDSPEKTIGAFSLVTPEFRALLPDFRAPLAEPAQDPVVDSFLSWTKKTPNGSALCQGDRSWSYDQMYSCARKITQSLRRGGFRRGDVVAVTGLRSFGLIASMIAVLDAGGVLLTLDDHLPINRRLLMLREGKAEGMLYVGLHRDAEIRYEQLTSLQVLYVEPDTGELEPGSPLEDRVLEDAEKTRLDDPAYIFFTSGTTGVPKAVLGTHKGLSHFLKWQRETFGVGPGDRSAQLTGLSFDVVLRDIFLSLTSGATLCLPAVKGESGPEEVMSWMVEQRITLLHTVPTLAQFWLAGCPPDLTLPELRLVFFAGEPLSGTLAGRWRELISKHGQIVNLYGPTETTLAKCFYVVPPDPSPGVQPLGLPLPQTQVLVMGKTGQACGIGEPGEIVIRTPFRSLGYANASEENRRRFLKNPFRDDDRDLIYHTGDRGRYRSDGLLEILGRIDGQIKIRGIRIELSEIEAGLLQHPVVKACAVIDRKEDQQVQLIAYIVTSRWDENIVPELKDYLHQQLPAALVPAYFIRLESLPLTVNGKVDRRSLPKFERPAAPHDISNLPGNLTEELMKGIWAEVLKREAVGITENFFELGGHSLLAMQLISRVRKVFGVEMPLKDLFQGPTAAKLSKKLEQLRQAGLGLDIPPLVRVEGSEEAPLSYVQERLWILDRMEPGNLAYHLAWAIRIRGVLNIEALERAVGEIIERHAILRTTFELRGEKLVQVIHPAARLGAAVVRRERLETGERENWIHQWATKEARQPFDLARGPLLRVKLTCISDEEHVLLCTLHHIISDGWSVEVLAREFEQLYEAFLQNKKSPLEPLPIQYADYAVWQRQWLQGAVLEKQLKYWREQLAGAPEELDLPVDALAGAGSASGLGRAEILLPAERVRLLETFARSQEMTPFMIMIAGLTLVLNRWSGQSDLVIGTVVAGRRNQQVEKLIGCFLNFLPLRVKLDGNHRGAELLAQVKAVWMEAWAHQDCPFEQIVNAVNPQRKPGRNPLYNVGFLLQNLPYHDLSEKFFKTERMAANPQGVLLDLRFVARKAGGGILLTCEYRTDLFHGGTIEDLLASFDRALEMLTEQSHSQVSDFKLGDKLVAQARAARERRCAQTIAITATFTAEPIEEILHFWAQELEIPIRVRFAPYNQVFQELLDAESESAANRHGLNVVLVRFEDWEMFGAGSYGNGAAGLLEKVAEFARALKLAGSRGSAPYLVCVCPESEAISRDPERVALYRKAQDNLTRDLAEMRGVFFVTAEEWLASYQISKYHDTYGDKIGHVPFNAEFFSALGTLVVRKFHALRRRACKVIALDCDQTLWAGVCGEDGVEGVKLTKSNEFLQKFMLSQLSGGRLLCLCSRNNEEDVDRVFERRPEFPLRPEHFAARRINWQSKSENLRALSEELQLGLDSFIFIDDSPTECAEVQANCPEVMTLQLPERPEQIGQFLDHCWLFDQVKLTAEDAQRTQFYKRERERQGFQSSSRSLADFIAGLDLKVKILPMAVEEVTRVVQLAERVNQFNFAAQRLTEGEIRQIQRAMEILVVSVSDRFGDYGLVGMMTCELVGGSMKVDHFLLSCRALGKGVEHQMLVHLGKKALSAGVEYVDIFFRPTSKNQPALNFLGSLESKSKEGAGEHYCYRFTPAVVAATAFNPVPATAPPARRQDSLAEINTESAGQLSRYRWIASEACSAAQIVGLVKAKTRKCPGGLTAYVPPRIPTEELLCGIWHELLRVEPIGVQHDFFESGGNSLLAIRLVLQIREVFGVELPLKSIFEAPTVAQLAEKVKDARREDLNPAPKIASVQERDSFPLSFAQERLWWLYLIYPNFPFNMRLVFQIEGNLNLELLRESFHAVFRRHEMLRTSFQVIAGLTRQVVVPDPVLEMPLIVLSNVPSAEREAMRLIEEDLRQPFNLADFPLFRVKVFHLGQDRHIFMLVMHHVLADGWSTQVLLKELVELYGAFSKGRPSQLPEIPIQYGDFAAWQRNWLQGKKLASQLEYWKGKLRGDLPVLELPTNRSRPLISSRRGAIERFIVDKRTSDQLELLSQQNGVTLFMTLVTAFGALLYRYTGQEDILVGTHFAGRNQKETESLIGFFINRLLLRSNLSGNPTIEQLLQQTRELTLQAYQNGDIPFEQVAAELKHNRNLNRTSLVQVMIVLENEPEKLSMLPDLKVNVIEVGQPIADVDIYLSFVKTPGGLQGQLQYSADIFDRSRIIQITGHFLTILDSIINNPRQRVSDLNLLSEPEHRQLLEWNDTRVDYPDDQCLHELFEEQVGRTPEAVAVVYEQQELSYRTLNERSNQLAHYLRKRGVGPEVLVGICLERSVEMVVGLLGILKAGGAYVPLDPHYPKNRLAFMLKDAQVEVVLTQNRFRERVGAVRETICLDDWPAGNERNDNPRNAVWAKNMAYMIYTSGSTGNPKGAINTHEGIHNRLQWMQAAYQLEAGDSILQKTPYTFDVSVWEFFWPLLCGARLVVAQPEGHRDVSYLMQLMERERITTVHFVPSMLRAFLEEANPVRCGALKRVICSGESLSVELVRRFYERLPGQLHNLYGPTEASVDVTYWACPRPMEGNTVPIGKPIANMEVHILDEHLNPVPVGIKGAIYLGGVGLGRGYFGRVELTGEKFIPHPFSPVPGERLYRTGDWGRYLPDGNVEFLGRMDHQVKVRGYRIELGEIEAMLSGHALVEQAIVMVREEKGEKRIVGYVVARPGASVGELRNYLKGKLPEYMVPAFIIMLDAFPLMPNGKIDRNLLPEPEAITNEMADLAAPETPIEKELAAVWQRVLKVEQIGIHQNFFDLGGHSLMATQIITQIRDVFHIELPLRTLFTGDFTIAGLVRIITERQLQQIDQTELAGLLTQLEGLSDKEARELLSADSKGDAA